jgi:hypothetical protein
MGHTRERQGHVGEGEQRGVGLHTRLPPSLLVSRAEVRGRQRQGKAGQGEARASSCR